MANPSNPDSRPPQGSGFTNLSSILNANRGNRLGDTVINGARGDINNASQDLSNEQSGFNTQLAAAKDTNTGNQKTIDQVFNTLDTSKKYQSTSPYDKAGYTYDPNIPQLNSSTLVYPGAPELNDTDYANFDKVKNSSYKGPTGYENETRLQQEGQNSLDLSTLSGSNAGRQELARRYVGNPNYTTADQRLDSLYLGNSGQNFNELGREGKQVNNQIAAGVDAAKQQSGDVSKDLTNLKANALNQISKKDNDLKNLLQNRQTNANTDYVAQNAAVQAGLASRNGTMDSELRDRLGIGYSALPHTGNPAFGTNLGNFVGLSNKKGLFGVDPTSFATATAAPTVNSVAETPDYAKVLALAKLAGTNQSLISDPTQVNSFTGNPYTFDKAGLDQAILDKKTSFLDAEKPVQTELDAISNELTEKIPQLKANARNLGHQYDPTLENADLAKQKALIEKINSDYVKFAGKNNYI